MVPFVYRRSKALSSFSRKVIKIMMKKIRNLSLRVKAALLLAGPIVLS